MLFILMLKLSHIWLRAHVSLFLLVLTYLEWTSFFLIYKQNKQQQ